MRQSSTCAAASLAWVTHGHATPAYVAPEDEPILRMMAATIGMQSARPVLALSGVIGAQLLDMALATRRLWLAPDGYTDSVTRARALRALMRRRWPRRWRGEALDRSWYGDEVETPQRATHGVARKAAQDADAASMPIIALTPPLGD